MTDEPRHPVLREAVYADIPELAILDRVCFPAYAYSADLIMRFLDLGLPCVVAEGLDGGIEGFAMAMPEVDERTCVLVTLDVSPEARRRGLGTRMLAWCARTVREAFPTTELMWLTVARGNGGARAFYHRLGFREADLIEGYYTDDDAVVMVHLDMVALAGDEGPR
jgi:ribosomal-protein-alanine N-acetyltransferase